MGVGLAGVVEPDAGLVVPVAGAGAAGFAEPVLLLPTVVDPFAAPLVGVALVPPGVELLAGNSVIGFGASGTGFESALATSVFN